MVAIFGSTSTYLQELKMKSILYTVIPYLMTTLIKQPPHHHGHFFYLLYISTAAFLLIRPTHYSSITTSCPGQNYDVSVHGIHRFCSIILNNLKVKHYSFVKYPKKYLTEFALKKPKKEMLKLLSTCTQC